MSIQENAMLVKWTICSWGASKRDQQETEKLCRENKTTKEWKRANKSLLPEAALKPLHQVEREARDYHYRMTVPYDDDGWRILPVALYPEYKKIFEKLKQKDYDLTEVLCDDLPRLKEEARENLNGSYCEEDYPTADELWELFDMTMTVRPIPEGKNLRLDLKGADLNELQATVDAEVSDTLKTSMMDLWYRLRARVYEAAKGFTDGKAVYECWVDNLKELTELLPKLNLTGDKDLDAITREVKQSLTTIDINAVRQNKTVRTAAASAAQKALGKLDAVIATRKINLDLE